MGPSRSPSMLSQGHMSTRLITGESLGASQEESDHLVGVQWLQPRFYPSSDYQSNGIGADLSDIVRS